MNYTPEFKLMIAKRAMKAKTYKEVAIEYGIVAENVRAWHDEYLEYGDLAFVKGGKAKFKNQKIKELEKKIAEMEEENEILKKATAVFLKYQK